MEYMFYDKFEYMLLYVGGLSLDSIVRKLNELGQLGWEYMLEKNDNYILKRKLIKYDINK